MTTAGTALADVRYAFTALGTLGGSDSFAHGINDLGQVVGESHLQGDNDYHAFLFDANTHTLHDLDQTGVGRTSQAKAISNAGHIVGLMEASTGIHAFQIVAGKLEDLGTLGGWDSRAWGVNSAGVIVGGANVSGPYPFHAYRRTGNGMTDLGTLGGENSEAVAINDAGIVVGYSLTATDIYYHGFVVDANGMRDLGTLGGGVSFANAINNAGQIAGCADDANNERHAVVWEGDSINDLGILDGAQSCMAVGINEAGTVVGEASYGGGLAHAFICENGVMSDLNDLIEPASGWTLSYASDVNNFGQIVGWGTIEGHTHAFLLTPIPEPAALTTTAATLAPFARRRGRPRVV